jgi:hypothetical protein
MRRIHFFVVVFFLLALLPACVTSLESYEPKGPDEDAIKALLVKWESTWNSRDVKGHLGLWNNKAEIMYGKDRKIATKKEYETILPERMEAVSTLKLGAPEIKSSGDKADVTLNMSVGSHKTPVTFHLIKETDKWSMMSWDY